MDERRAETTGTATMAMGLYTYPWDLEAEGYAEVVDAIADAGFTAVNLACAYHTGRFLLPHNPRHRVYFAEDGAFYFRPRPERYGRLQPRLSRFVSGGSSPLAALDAARRARGLDLVAWVVLLHNSWLGERHPDCAMRNAFGDPYIHSLDPAHPAVREYALALVEDVVRGRELSAIELESPGAMSFTHGYHHEITGVALDATQERLLGISFTEHEMLRAGAAGIDVEGVRRRVASLLETSWERAGGLTGSDGAPTDDASALLDDADFQAYGTLRADIVTRLGLDLYAAIKGVSPDTRVRQFAALNPGEVSDDARTALPRLADEALAGYATSDADARERTAELREIMGGKPVLGMIRAIAPDTVDPATVAPRVAAWREAGVAGINVYNYGLMTRRMLAAFADLRP